MAATDTVGALARAAGVTPKTVRYYETLGLLPRAERADNGYRRYGPDSVDRLIFVRRAKALGLTLEEIHDLILATHDARCDLLTLELREVLARKLAACDQQIAALTTLRQTLANAAASVSSGRAGSCVDADQRACSAFQAGCDCLPSVGPVAIDIALLGKV